MSNVLRITRNVGRSPILSTNKNMLIKPSDYYNPVKKRPCDAPEAFAYMKVYAGMDIKLSYFCEACRGFWFGDGSELPPKHKVIERQNIEQASMFTVEEVVFLECETS